MKRTQDALFGEWHRRRNDGGRWRQSTPPRIRAPVRHPGYSVARFDTTLAQNTYFAGRIPPICYAIPLPGFRQVPVHARTYIALLEDSVARALARTFARDGVPLITFRSSREFMAMVREEPVAFALDPALISEAEAEELISRVRAASLPATLYVPMIGVSVSRAFALAQAAPMLVVLENADRSVAPLAATVLASNHCAYAAILLDILAPSLAPLPRTLTRAIERLFAEPASESLTTLARRSALSRRSLDRWLGRAGITSPRLLVASPRFLRALTLARETELSARRIAYLCGYTSARRLRNHTQALTGMTWTEMQTVSEPQRVVAAVAQMLLAPVCGTTDDTSVTDEQLTVHQTCADAPGAIAYTAADARTGQHASRTAHIPGPARSMGGS